ncbi:hypothetical protein JCM4814A_35760 [Streptomyces phaeofaciens JCM 4814]|uniref:Uncharacterized protein n=1 Tax=Streptomyces phaeofaciens TaxID=68254 RepID=A0A918M0G3_9ACTN|nr:hypothetical protein [Streptomyces phaeofaciens]GGT84703.1 hypothetical protein GCM10010226_74160 [Streptomyces phaeofaciens]
MSDLVGDARHLSPSAQEALRLRAIAAAYLAALVGNSASGDVAAPVGDDSDVDRVRVEVHSAEHRVRFSERA